MKSGTLQVKTQKQLGEMTKVLFETKIKVSDSVGDRHDGGVYLAYFFLLRYCKSIHLFEVIYTFI